MYDTQVLLDYSRNGAEPTVRYLHLKADNRSEWIQGARDFDDFAMTLG